MTDTTSIIVAAMGSMNMFTTIAFGRKFVLADRNSAMIQDLEKARITDRKELSDQLETTVKRQDSQIQALVSQNLATNQKLFETQQELIAAKAEILQGRSRIAELEAENERLKIRIVELEREISGNVIGHITGVSS